MSKHTLVGGEARKLLDLLLGHAQDVVVYKIDRLNDEVTAMLRRPEGATVEEVARATGWQRHTVRDVRLSYPR